MSLWDDPDTLKVVPVTKALLVLIYRLSLAFMMLVALICDASIAAIRKSFARC